jgi:shikimate kinase
MSHATDQTRDAALKRSVFLTGFMGVGKSTVGSLLAHALGCRFVDSDQLIEAEAGLSIAQLFQQRGEAAFRELERAVVQRLATEAPAVVALGGGALMNPRTRSAVNASGTLVYLSANPEHLLERLKSTADTRPLLAGLTSEQRQERIRSMLSDRRPIYESADFRVETDGLTPSEVAERVRSRLQEHQP